LPHAGSKGSNNIKNLFKGILSACLPYASCFPFPAGLCFLNKEAQPAEGKDMKKK